MTKATPQSDPPITAETEADADRADQPVRLMGTGQHGQRKRTPVRGRLGKCGRH